MFQEYFEEVSRKYYGNFKGVSKNFRDVLRKFQKTFQAGFKGSFLRVSRIFHEIFKGLSRGFQGSFKNFFKVFQGRLKLL